jgi:NO-binding membrane sensor protein with MHYT domain
MVSSSALITGSHNYGLVAASVLISMCASYAALDLGARITASRGWFRSSWLIGVPRSWALVSGRCTSQGC